MTTLQSFISPQTLETIQDIAKRATKREYDRTRQARLRSYHAKTGRHSSGVWIRPLAVQKDYERVRELRKLGLTPSWREWTGAPWVSLGVKVGVADMVIRTSKRVPSVVYAAIGSALAVR